MAVRRRLLIGIHADKKCFLDKVNALRPHKQLRLPDAMKSSPLLMVSTLVVVTLAATAVALPVIQPRPVDNRRDPHDGEPFEWEPVDDDPWPGPSFTFQQLPGIDEFEAAAGRRPASLPEAHVRASLLMQLLRSIFNNASNQHQYRGDQKTIASNEVVALVRNNQIRSKYGHREVPAIP